MSLNPEDEKAIADNIQRTVETTSIRKARALADELHIEEARQLSTQKRWVIASAVALLVFFAIWAWQDHLRQQRKEMQRQVYACQHKVLKMRLPLLRKEDILREQPSLSDREAEALRYFRHLAVQDKAVQECLKELRK